MPRYLIDVNLPRYFSLWNTPDYIFQHDIDARSKDHQIWAFAKKSNLIIVSKDSDFSNRILLSEPPPKVIHIRLGNMDMNNFYTQISKCWQQVLELSESHKLITVFENHIEGIK